MGEIHLALGQWSEAHPYFEKLRDAGSTPAAKAAARLGFLALRDLNYESAEVQLKRALDLDSRDPGAWFEYAMLRRARAAPAQEVERHLRRTLELSPLYAEAWYFLASSLERRGALEEALAALEKATSLLPRQSPFWEARARLEWKLDRREPAVQSARQAVACARTPNETQMAEGLLRDFEEALQPPAPSRTRIATPPAWNPAPASASAEGLLTRIDCLDNSLLFHMRLTDGTVLLLRADGPASIRLEAESTPAEFSCGVLSAPRTVRVHYNPLPPGAAAAGTLIRLGFR
jgi:tetratricopeptide (TPR) repeat protein